MPIGYEYSVSRYQASSRSQHSGQRFWMPEYLASPFDSVYKLNAVGSRVLTLQAMAVAAWDAASSQHDLYRCRSPRGCQLSQSQGAEGCGRDGGIGTTRSVDWVHSDSRQAQASHGTSSRRGAGVQPHSRWIWAWCDKVGVSTPQPAPQVRCPNPWRDDQQTSQFGGANLCQRAGGNEGEQSVGYKCHVS